MQYEKSPLYKAARGLLDTMAMLDILMPLGLLAAFIAWLVHFFHS